MKQILLLTPHVISTRIKKQCATVNDDKVIIAFWQEFDHRNNQLMLLTGALLVATTNTTILNKSKVL